MAKPARSLTILWSLLIATGVAAFVWAVARPPQPMPSMERTNALVRAHARGVFFSERRTRADLEKATFEFRKAIAADDRFAEPHAALAEVCVRLIEIGSPNVAPLESEARKEVARSLELGPHLALSHAAQASVQFVLDRDAALAERSFLHAIELDPSLPGIRRRYSYVLQQALADEAQAFLVVADRGVLEHLPGQRQLTRRICMKRESEEEDRQELSHAPDSAPGRSSKS